MKWARLAVMWSALTFCALGAMRIVIGVPPSPSVGALCGPLHPHGIVDVWGALLLMFVGGCAVASLWCFWLVQELYRGRWLP